MYFYRPQTKLRKGNVFTPVCQSFCSRGVAASVHAWILGRHPPGQTHTPGQTPPRADTPPNQTASAADGTHPTGMLSCVSLQHVIKLYKVWLVKKCAKTLCIENYLAPDIKVYRQLAIWKVQKILLILSPLRKYCFLLCNDCRWEMFKLYFQNSGNNQCIYLIIINDTQLADPLSFIEFVMFPTTNKFSDHQKPMPMYGRITVHKGLYCNKNSTSILWD